MVTGGEFGETDCRENRNPETTRTREFQNMFGTRDEGKLADDFMADTCKTLTG